MKRRYIFVLTIVIALLSFTGGSVMAQPADPGQAISRHGPVVRVGVAWGAIVRDHAEAHNFTRPPTEELPIFTVLPGARVHVTAGANGIWLGQSGGTLSAHLEVYGANEQGADDLLGEDRVSETKEGPAFEHRTLGVPVSFEQPGEVHLLARLTATAEAQEGETARDVDELEAIVIVLDPSTFGAISGQVTDEDTGESLEGILVTAGNRDLRIHRAARTDASGNYAIDGLAPGEYLVGAQAKGTPYVGELYDDAHSLEEATVVTVMEASETTDVAFGLARGGEISGRVIDQGTGEPLSGIGIMVRPVRPADDDEVAGLVHADPTSALQAPSASRGPGELEPRPAPGPSDKRHALRPAAVTDDEGSYVVQGLRAGEYTVAAVGARQGYGVEFWEEAGTLEQATPIAVELKQSVGNIDFTLEPR